MINDTLSVRTAPLAGQNFPYCAAVADRLDERRAAPSSSVRQAPASHAPYCYTTRKALKLMQRNVEKPMALAQLAASVGVSPRQIQRLFKQHLDTTPQSYYLQVRISKARRLLRNTRAKVLDVALACGFVSPNHFSRNYKALYGYPPSHERRVDG
ncbi:helix-turn-helix domain-containing protein [Pseudomonas sp.]|uniref:helix-turn-helix domain-containing protein n=1 Tax=Pseudomonas sp. TaxID=306 RepID=UPI0028B14B0F|nr:helix-turn-helix domain-containing protein [Pseudomonas sp.]